MCTQLCSDGAHHQNVGRNFNPDRLGKKFQIVVQTELDTEFLIYSIK